MRGLALRVIASAALALAEPAAAADDLATCRAQGEPDQRIGACSRVIAAGQLAKSDLSLVHNSRGFAYMKKREFDRAVFDFDKAIELNPTNSSAYNNRGWAFNETREYERAIPDLDKSIALNPTSPAHNNRGWALRLGRQDYDRALADFTEALRLNPDYAPALSGRGGVFMLQRDYERALADFEAAVRFAPTVANHWANRGTAKVRLGRFDEALSDYDEALRLNPNHTIAHVGRGASYRQKGDHEQALTHLDKALRLDPNQARAFYHRGMIFAARDETARALADLRRAAEINPKDDEVQEALARLTGGAASASSSTGARVALVIGNGDYRHSNKLNNPGNDAGDVAAALRRLGFDVVEGSNLDKRGMEDKVREFGRKLDRADLALFFYAGHGLQVGGKNYLVPIDAKLERPGDLNFETIDVGHVLGQMEAEQRVNLVFLDACRDNPLSRSLARSLGTRSSSVGQGLATIQSAVGTMIAYATQPDNVALDGDGRNSPFTGALLKHLATPGLEIGAVMRRVRADVIKATRSRQVPWDHSSLVGDVILVR